MRVVLAGMFSVAVAFTIVLGVGFWLQPGDWFGILGGVGIPLIAGGLMCAILGIRPRKRIRVQRRHEDLPAFTEPPKAAETCVHLRPIEQAMRLAGISVSPMPVSAYGPTVRAFCRINEAELKAKFALPPSVYYQEQYMPERSPWDNPRADIFCAECLKTNRPSADILVLHPEESRPDTPWFP